jgi:general secretion pathway protein L
VTRIRLAGEAGGWPGLAALVEEDLGTTAEPLRLTGPAAEAIPAEDVPRYALPLALALRGWMGNRFQRLNLRRGDLASTRSHQDVRERLQRIAVYASLVLLLGVVSSVVKVVALNRQEKLLDRSMCEVTQKVVGKCFDDFATAESVLRGRGTVGASIPRVSAAGVLAELAARVPQVQLRFDRIEITREKLHLQGTTDAAENVDRIVSALRGSRCFGDTRSGGARKRGTEQKFEFTVDADITCEGAAAAPGGKG